MAKVEIPNFNAPNAVSGSDRADAIEFVNRVNWLFDIWDVEGIAESFLPDAVTRHPHGVVSGPAGLRQFLEAYYPLAIPGVSREATNHVVDADGDDVVVRYHNLLIRYAMPEDVEAVRNATEVISNDDGLPAIVSLSPMIDRLRRTDDGFKIVERLVGGTVANNRYRAKQG
jgi:SnoaL-like domain